MGPCSRYEGTDIPSMRAYEETAGSVIEVLSVCCDFRDRAMSMGHTVLYRFLG